MAVWENEGGAAAFSVYSHRLTGTPAQVEWAGRIRHQLDAEFERVAAALRSVARKQRNPKRGETHAILAILRDKRGEVMRRNEAGYFIRDWQEIGDRIRKLLMDDPRYQEIRNRRASRAG